MSGLGPKFVQLANTARGAIQCCDPTEVQQQLASNTPPVLIDVREANEWQAGHVQGAVHLSKGMLECKIEQLVPNPQTPIVLYCSGGYRSALAAYNLKQMGYDKVISMEGGFSLWQKLGYPVE